VDRNAFPHAKLRAAIFWIVFVMWPPLIAIGQEWHPWWWWYIADVGATATSTLFLVGKMAFQDTQKEFGWRLRRVESRVMGAESVAPFFAEDGRIRAPVKPPPGLRVVQDDSGGASPPPSPGAR
jgi:hypothetical protein